MDILKHLECVLFGFLVSGVEIAGFWELLFGVPASGVNLQGSGVAVWCPCFKGLFAGACYK